MFGSILLSGGNCQAWAQQGGLTDTSYGIVIDDSSTGKFLDWFGATRPQMLVISPSGEFLDISPNTDCGQCGSWTDGTTDAKYDALLEPYNNGTVEEKDQPGLIPPPTSHTPPLFKHMLTSTVLLLSIVACLYVQV